MGKDISKVYWVFSAEYFKKFKKDNKDISNALKNCNVEGGNLDLLRDFAISSVDNQAVAFMYIVKHAPDGSDLGNKAKSAIEDYIGQLFDREKYTGGIDRRSDTLDGMLDFLYDNKKMHKYFCDLVDSWKKTDVILSRMSKPVDGPEPT